MKKRKILASILMMVLCCGLLFVLAACPPLPEYTGIPVSGVILNGETALELKNVDFEFNIVDYPSKSEFTNTESSANITYVIDNSSASDVILPLYLLVEEPRYDYYDGNFDVVSNYKQYQITTSASHETSLRCVNSRDISYYYYSDSAAKVKAFLESLHDEKRADDYYNSELLIYKYTYAISDLSKPDGVSILLFESDALHYQNLFFDKTCSFRSSVYGNGGYDCYVDLDGSNTVTFYSIGIELTAIEENVKFCDGAENVIENGGKITAVSNEMITFDDLAMTYYDGENDISETDWYNAVLTIVKDGFRRQLGLKFLDVSDELYYMYQCNLTVPAQSPVTLEVEMPLYPTINSNGYTADVYEYKVDLSNLSNWSGTPDVSVSVVTDGYFVDSPLQFEATSTGYNVLKVDNSLQNFVFTLSETPDVESVIVSIEKAERKVLTDIIVTIGVCYLVPIVTVSVVLGCDNAKRKRKLKSDETTTSSKL